MNKYLMIVFFILIAVFATVFHKRYFKNIFHFGKVNQSIQSEEKGGLTHTQLIFLIVIWANDAIQDVLDIRLICCII